MVVGSHNSTGSEEGAEQLPELLRVRLDLTRGYLKAMSLAFFEVHLRDRTFNF